jgi:hypothetical protein
LTRYVVIRNSAREELVVGETPLPSEADLHNVLTSHPELLPAEDIGLGQVVVVGQESGLRRGTPTSSASIRTVKSVLWRLRRKETPTRGLRARRTDWLLLARSRRRGRADVPVRALDERHDRDRLRRHDFAVPYRPFDEESRRRDLQRRLNGINGVKIPDAKLDRWPSFKISALAEREALAEFIRIMEWTFDEAEEARRRLGPVHLVTSRDAVEQIERIPLHDERAGVQDGRVKSSAVLPLKAEGPE